MTTFFRQSDPSWSHCRLGHGPSTIGRAGCLLTALCQARVWLHDDDKTARIVEPVDANLRCLDAGAFVGSGLVVAKAAQALGLVADPSLRRSITSGDDALRNAIRDAFERGDVVLLHVDHDSTLAHGDPEGDHWILALRLELVDHHDTPGVVSITPELVCADPATGREARISLRTLHDIGGTWKPYRVTDVQPVSRLAQKG